MKVAVVEKNQDMLDIYYELFLDEFVDVDCYSSL